MPQLIKKSEIEQYVGHICEPTDWFKVTQEQVNVFADCTLDRQFIHIDPEAAAKSPFGGTIAHGFLTLSMLAYFSQSFSLSIEGSYMGVNKGFGKVCFVTRVTVVSKIRCHTTVAESNEKKPPV